MRIRVLMGCLCLASTALALADDGSRPISPVLQAFVDRQIIAGAVTLVVDKDATFAVDCVGSASLRTKRPMHSDDLFWIASMTKPITATALMMLVDEGKVQLAEPVEKYLPEFKGQLVADGNGPPRTPTHPITVREIMSHTSGLVPANSPVLRNSQDLRDLVARCGKTPLIREPGTKYEYNNSGINTGGRIVEVAGGLPYAEFLRRRLFDPLGMKDTTFWPSESQAARLAHTTRRGTVGGPLEEIQLAQNVTPALIERLGHGTKVPLPMLEDMGIGQIANYAHHFAEPAGGLHSTASDLGNFCQMLLAGGVYRGRRLLSEEAVRAMTSNQTGRVPVNPQEGYGIGWSVKVRDDEGPSVGSFGHRGARRTAMWIDPQHGIAMIVLIERLDMTGKEQNELYSSFFKTAIASYGKASH